MTSQRYAVTATAGSRDRKYYIVVDTRDRKAVRYYRTLKGATAAAKRWNRKEA